MTCLMFCMLWSAPNQVSSETIVIAREFAERHHPELNNLLDRLDPQSRQFVDAINDLNRQVARLKKLQDRSPDRYIEALETWKLDSRVRVAVAKVAADPGNDELSAHLDSLLREKHERRLETVGRERERAERRLNELNEQYETISSQLEKMIAADRERMLRLANGSRQRAKRDQSSRGEKR